MMRSVLLLVSSSSDEEEPSMPGLVAAERMGLLGVTVCVCVCVYVCVIVPIKRWVHNRPRQCGQPA